MDTTVIGLQNEELLVQHDWLVDFWVEEAFIWTVVAFAMANIAKKLQFCGVLSSKALADNLGSSAIA